MERNGLFQLLLEIGLRFFQSLQQHTEIIQKPQERGEVCSSFFDETVPKVLQLLMDVNGRNAREEQHALTCALDADWEFRFTVNYFLRQAEHNNKPYEQLQSAIDHFFSKLTASKGVGGNDD